MTQVHTEDVPLHHHATYDAGSPRPSQRMIYDYDHAAHSEGRAHGPHVHGHGHGHQHAQHAGSSGVLGTIASAVHLPGYGHTHTRAPGDLVRMTGAGTGGGADDSALATRTVWLALLVLGLTAVVQVIIYLASGSVALLADTVHNLGDALNSVPLLLAFYLARRAATTRYTYGYHRAEDVAGVAIVLSIAFSAVYILWESVQKLLHPHAPTQLGWVALAAVAGFLGNEGVAQLQIRVGQCLGSAAMIADGVHARTDGFTSLAVLVAAGGAALGFPLLDPLIGMLISIAIVFIICDAARSMWYRLMDAVDPALVAASERVIGEHPEVQRIARLQLRWLGHQLRAEVELVLSPHLSFEQSATVTDHLRHHLHHALPRLAEATIAAMPLPGDTWGDNQGNGESAHHALPSTRSR